MFFRGYVQLTAAQSSSEDSVEVRFRESIRDHLRKGAVLTCARWGPATRVSDGGGAVDLMIELVYCDLFLLSSTPLDAFGVCIDSFAECGCVGGRACGRARLALPEHWRRNALVSWGCDIRGAAASGTIGVRCVQGISSKSRKGSQLGSRRYDPGGN